MAVTSLRIRTRIWKKSCDFSSAYYWVIVSHLLELKSVYACFGQAEDGEFFIEGLLHPVA